MNINDRLIMIEVLYQEISQAQAALEAAYTRIISLKRDIERMMEYSEGKSRD